MHARPTKKIPRILPASIVLAYLERCGFSAQTASCGLRENALTARSPNCVCLKLPI